MNEKDTSRIADLQDALSEVQAPPIKDLPFELFDKLHRKTTQLLASSPTQQSIDGKNRWYDFSFRQPQFVTTVEIVVDGYSGQSDFAIRWRNELGIDRETVASPTNGKIVFAVSELCSKFSFRPPATWFANTSIQQIKVNGIERADIPVVLEALSDLENHKLEMLSIVESAIAKADERIAEAQIAIADRGAVQREVDNAKNNLARVRKQIDQANLSKSELIAQNAATDSALADASSRLQRTVQENERLVVEQGVISQDISTKTNELTSLKSQVGLFPVEIVDFVRQGNSSIILYTVLSLIPISIIFIMFLQLINGAADLTTILTRDKEVNVATALLTRAPYVIVATAVITACYGITRTFVHQLIKINDQRLSLSKISIIAKDVSAAAEHDLNIPLEDAYRLRAELKMKLLGEHLKNYLPQDFSLSLPQRLLGQSPVAVDDAVEQKPGLA